MINYDGKIINEALPSSPVEILGMNSSAYAGAEFSVTKDENEAKKLAELLPKILEMGNRRNAMLPGFACHFFEFYR